MAVYKLSKFLDPSSTATLPPGDVTFVFKNDQQIVVGEVKAHKNILGFASDVFFKEFFGNFKSEDIVEIKDSTKEVFELFIAFIYGKQQSWKTCDLETIASLYYLSDKYNVPILGDELISFISEQEIDKNSVLEVATLAQENILLEDLSKALFMSATKCLRKEFGSSSKKVFDFYTDQPGIDESHALIIFKMMSMMKTVPNAPVCLNCKMPGDQCLDGVGISSANFVPGAKVTLNPNYGFHTNVSRLGRKTSDNTFIGIRSNGSEVGQLYFYSDYFMYNCLS